MTSPTTPPAAGDVRSLIERLRSGEWCHYHKVGPNSTGFAIDPSPLPAQAAAALERLDRALDAERAARERAEAALRDFREHVIRHATQWSGGGGSPSHPIWERVADALESESRPDCGDTTRAALQPQQQQGGGDAG